MQRQGEQGRTGGLGWRRYRVGVEGDGSGPRGPGGEVDGRWLKLNSRVGKK